MSPELIEQIKTNLAQLRQYLPGYDPDKIIASVAHRFNVSVDEVRAIDEGKLAPEELPDQAQPDNKPEQQETSTPQPTKTPEQIGRFLQIAMDALERGETRVLPIKVGGKNPLTAWLGSELDTYSLNEWNKIALDQIDIFAKAFPDANACVVAKPDEFCFTDCDTYREFVAGYEAFSGEKFPVTYTTSARDNRVQIHFRQTEKTRALGNVTQFDANGIDLSFRQRNEYVLAEGSQHKNQVDVYKRVVDAPIIPMPDKLVGFIEHLWELWVKANPASFRTSSGSVADDWESVDTSMNGPKIPFGQHDNTLFRIACSLRQKNEKTREEALEHLIQVCQTRCENRGSDYVDMCEKKIKSAWKYPVKPPAPSVIFDGYKNAQQQANAAANASKNAQGIFPNGNQVVIVKRMSEYQNKKIEWLWENRIALGESTTIAADPDEGKSLICLYLAAKLSKGEPMYGSSPGSEIHQGETLILSAEEDPENTLGPRLDAAGADKSKVLRLDSVMLRDGQGKTLQQRELQLDTDLQEIKKVVEANPNIKLVVIDPISSYLGKIRMNDEQEVRRVLKPLVDLARQKQFAVVLIIHFNKNREAKSAIDRVGGAKGLIGLGRAAWTCYREEKDEGDLSGADIHLFLKLKNNLVPSKVGGLRYEIRSRKVRVQGKTGPEMVDIPYIEWIGATNTIAQDVLIGDKPAGAGKLDAAKTWLQRHLELHAGIDTRASVIHLGETEGHSERTLDRAKVELRIKTVFPEGPEAYWELPGHKSKTKKQPVKFGGYTKPEQGAANVSE